MRKSFVLMLFCLLCAGCVPRLDLEAATQVYRAKAPCCADLSQLAVQPVAEGKTRFAIDGNGQLFNFQDGVSYYQGFELPGVGANYTVAVRSYIFSDGYPAKRTAVFYPVVTILDERKNAIRTSGIDDLRLLQSSFSDEPNERPRCEVSMEVKEADRARYVIVHTPSNIVGIDKSMRTSVGSQMIAVPGAFVVVGGGPVDLVLRGSPVTPADGLEIRIVKSTQQ